MFLIVTGGEHPGRGLLAERASRAAYIIAADRGGEYCLDAGVMPHLIVGDMDSLDEASAARLAGSGAEVRRFSHDKDRTDTEIALDEAILKGATRVEILGALGGRIDHTLANLHLLRTALQHGVEARIVTETQQVFLVDAQATIENSQGCTVSFLPLTEKVSGITLTGFAYDLADAVMELGRPYGVSNVVRSPRARVTLRQGLLLAVLSTAW